MYKKLNRPATSVWFRWVNIVQSFVFSVNYASYSKTKNSWATENKTNIALC